MGFEPYTNYLYTFCHTITNLLEPIIFYNMYTTCIIKFSWVRKWHHKLLQKNSFTFLFEAMKETHEQHKTSIDIDELITRTPNITLMFWLHSIPLNSFYVLTMANSLISVTLYLSCVLESFRLKNAIGLLSWVISAPNYLLEVSV